MFVMINNTISRSAVLRVRGYQTSSAASFVCNLQGFYPFREILSKLYSTIARLVCDKHEQSIKLSQYLFLPRLYYHAVERKTPKMAKMCLNALLFTSRWLICGCDLHLYILFNWNSI